MRLSTFSLLCLAILGFGSSVPGNQAKSDCENIGGTLAVAFTSELTTLGIVTGGLKGAVTATILEQSPGEDGTMNAQLEHVYVTEAGDVLHTADQAVLVPVNASTALMTEQSVIISGTGKFEGATGTLESTGVVDFAHGQVTLRYRGQICGGQ